MEEILDKPLESKKSKQYSNRAFKYSLLSFISITIMFMLFYYRLYIYRIARPNLFARNLIWEFVGIILPLLFTIFGIIAIVNAIRSIRRKEKSSFKKGLGITWSAILILFFILMIVRNFIVWFE